MDAVIECGFGDMMPALEELLRIHGQKVFRRTSNPAEASTKMSLENIKRGCEGRGYI